MIIGISEKIIKSYKNYTLIVNAGLNSTYYKDHDSGRLIYLDEEIMFNKILLIVFHIR